MANPEHLAILKQGVTVWNRWRAENRADPHREHPDLTDADLGGADLKGADLHSARLHNANLTEADLRGAWCYNASFVKAKLSHANLMGASPYMAKLMEADLRQANLRQAKLTQTDLSRANLSGADLSLSDLSKANLSEADLSGANLYWANLTRAIVVETNLMQANLTGCCIYGICAWNVRLDGATQSSLFIARWPEQIIQVDNIELAQFIYLLLNNDKIRQVIDTITSKVVLILGRFTPERKTILDAIREALRKRNYSPVVFDFEKPASRDLTETISTLAHMARFVIADITDAQSIPRN